MGDHVAVDIDAEDLVTLCGLRREDRPDSTVIWDRDALDHVSPELVSTRICGECLARLAG